MCTGEMTPLPCPRRQLPELEDDTIRDILLRFRPIPLPLGSSKDLIRVSLVCKRWCRILLDPAFPRYYRELHDPPPVLGFLCYRWGWDGNDFFFHERFAVVEGNSLYLWSQPAGHERPSVLRVVDLKPMLPVDAPSFSPIKFGLPEDAQSICLTTDAGTFMVELGSGLVTRTGERGCSSVDFVPPYLSHVTKDFLAATLQDNRSDEKEEQSL